MQVKRKDDLWCIAEDPFQLEHNKHYEGMFAQGSGYMSVRGCLEEGLPGSDSGVSKTGTYIPGVNGRHPSLKEEIINLPWFLELKVSFDGERLDMRNSRLTGYERWLDLRDGVLYRTFEWSTNQGALLKLTYRRFASMATKHLFVQEMTLSVRKGSGKVTVQSGIDANVTTNDFNHFNHIRNSIYENRAILMEVTTNGSNRVSEMSCLRSDSGPVWAIETGVNRISFTGWKELNEGGQLSVMKLTSVWTDRDLVQSDAAVHDALLQKAADEGYDALYTKHSSLWRKKWEFSDIRVDGDDEAQRAIRFSIYHLIRSNAEDDPRVAICAKGHAGEGYCGRYFWDTEIYLVPFFLHTHPKAARNLLTFRYGTLDAARAIAASYGYKGARYPWETTAGGEEQCPLHSHADNQVHVTADIVYAIWHYFKATGDLEFMLNAGIDVMVETSRYWCERTDPDQTGCYQILGVIGPDEYKPYVMNNAFTNRMVQWNLSKTAEFLRTMMELDRDSYDSIVQRLNLSEVEIERFAHIAGNIKIPYDKEKGIVLQCDDFERYADVDIDRLWKDKSTYFWKNVSWEKIFRSKTLKQADVLLLMTLFPDDFTDEQKRDAFRYYEPITVHDSSLSAVVHSLLLTRLGMPDEAYAFFKRSAGLDITTKNGGASDGIHIANAGGIWQLTVYGFAGMKSAMWAENPEFEPCLPKEWRSLAFSVVWHGDIYTISVTHEGVNIERGGCVNNENLC